MRISDWSSDVCCSDLKAEPDLRERQRELGGRRRFEPAFAEKLPQRGKEGSEENDIDGVDRLEHRCRHAADIDIAIGVEVKAAARLQIGRASCRERVCQYV